MSVQRNTAYALRDSGGGERGFSATIAFGSRRRDHHGTRTALAGSRIAYSVPRS